MKIMFLGGTYFQMNATKTAKKMGHHVISVDYLPDNPAHKFADEYYNVSTTDMEGVLALAQKLKIDGIVSYASDVSAPTAAYVSEKMGLITNPFESVMILTHKDLFRDFLQKNGFNCPKSCGFDNYEDALAFFKKLNKKAIVKPSDSSSSKGVTPISSDTEFKLAYDNAMSFSRNKRIVVEEFLVRKDHQIAGDCFIYNGEVIFTGFMSEHFDNNCNPLVPIGESYPSYMNDTQKRKLTEEISKLMKALKMEGGAINIDAIFDENDNVYIIDLGPRNGGNLISDIVRESSGIDLAEMTIKNALGIEIKKEEYMKPINKYISSYIPHALIDGKYAGIDISDKIKNDILLFKDFVNIGDNVKRFDNAALATGAMLLKFDSLDQMVYRMDNMNDFIKVNVEMIL